MLGRGSAAQACMADAAVAPVDAAREPAVEEQELTPLAVAIAVQSGLADAGLGSASTATELRLGFVPVAREDYDLVLMRQVAASPLGVALLGALRSDAFRAAVAPLHGYDAARSGAEKPVGALAPGGGAVLAPRR